MIAVRPGSPADVAGVRPGDVTQGVNREPVRSADDFRVRVAQSRSPELAFLVDRGGLRAYLLVEPAG